MEQTNKRRPIFYIIYFTILLLALSLIGVGLLFFSRYLADYEASLPKYVAAAVESEYFSPVDYGKLYDDGFISPSKYEGREAFVAHMTETRGTEASSLREVAAGLTDGKKYTLKAGEETLADVTLKKKTEKSRYGFDLWELDEIRVSAAASGILRVKLLAGSTLTIGGIPADPENRTERGLETPSVSHMPEGVSGMTYDLYTFSGLWGTPEPVATDRNGVPAQLLWDEEERLYVEQPNSDSALAGQYAERAVLAAQAYARFMTRDAYTGVLAKYFDETSETYRLIKNSDTWCYSNHLGYEFVGETTGEFYSYDADIFSCRYTCTHNVFFTKTDTRVFPLDLTLYFHKVGDDYFVYDLVTNS